MYHRRSEGDIVRQAVELNGIECVVKTAISMEAFDACLKIGMKEAMERLPGHIPLLHISAHGDGNGIQLSNGHNLTWRELGAHFRPINKALGGTLVVCMSSCEGYSGIQMAMDAVDPDLPFLALIGTPQKPTWSETAVAYATFYHQLSRGEHITSAVTAMQVASGNDTFWVQYGEDSRKSYIEYINNTITPAAAQTNLETLIENQVEGAQERIKYAAEPDGRG